MRGRVKSGDRSSSWQMRVETGHQVGGEGDQGIRGGGASRGSEGVGASRSGFNG